MASGALTDTLRETLAAFDEAGTPVTTSEMADRLDLGRRSTYERLERLADHGRIETKKVGARGRVWWRPPVDEPTDADSDRARSQLIDSMPGMVYRCRNEPGWPVSYASEASTDITGYDPATFEAGEISFVDDIVHPEDRDALRDAVEAQLATDGRFSVEYRIRTVDGETRWVRGRGCAVADEETGDEVLEGIITDINEAERSKQALTEQERLFHSLIEATEEYAIFMLDPEGVVRTWNEGARAIKGYERDEIVGEHFSVFYTDEDRSAGLPERNLTVATDEGATEDEGWRVRADGSRFWANVTITPIIGEGGDLRGFAKVTRDMTDRREREQQLRHERNLVDQIFETSPVGLGVLSSDGLERVNARAAEIYGSPTDEIDEYVVGEPDVYDADGRPVPPDERPNARVFRTGEPVDAWECQLETGDGRRRWLSVSAAPLREDDEVARVIVATEDISHLKEQTQQLERQRDELEAELNEVFERVNDAFYAVDEQFRFTYANKRAEELLDHSEAELLGESVWEVFPEATETPAWESFHDALETQEPSDYEVYFEPLGIWVKAHVYPSETGLSVYFRDITERKEQEHRLRRYETVVTAVPDAVYMLGPDGTIELINFEAIERLTGHTVADLEGRSFTTLMTAEDAEKARDGVREILSSTTATESVTQELTIQGRNGRSTPCENHMTVITGSNGELESIVGIIRDTSERKARERELERYETIIETVTDGVYAADDKYRFTMVNDAYAEMVGCGKEALIGQHISAVIDDESVSIGEKRRDDLIAGADARGSVELNIETAGGETITVETRYALLPDEETFGGTVGVVRDVTERREREQELQRFESIVETVPDGIYAVDLDGRFTLVNEGYMQMTGYSREKLLEMSASDVVDPETLERAAALEQELIAGERETARIEADIHRADGGSLRGEATFSIIEEDDGLERVGVVRDVTERMRRERELELYETIVETVEDGVYVLDEDFCFTRVNQAYAEMTGYDPEELIGEHCTLVIDEGVSAESAERLEKIMVGDAASAALEADILRADGSTLRAESRFTAIPAVEGDGTRKVGVVRDVSERVAREREREIRLHQQEAVTELGGRALESRDVNALLAEAAAVVAETLDNDYCKVLDLDVETEELLLRQGVGWDDGVVGSATISATEDDSQAAYTLASKEPVVVEDLLEETRFSGPDLLTDHSVRSGISTIIGPPDEPWGVLGTHDRDPGRPSEYEVHFVQSVANILASAINRQADEAELVRQRERLAALDDLNAVVRNLSGAIIEQSTREEIETIVCEGLAATDSYRFAWIGEVETGSQTIRLRTEAGVDGYLDDRTISVDDEADGPIARAVQTKETQVVDDVFDNEAFEPWREHAREWGYRAAAVIPIVHEEMLHGVLCVYTDRTDAFSTTESPVIAHLGEVTGHAIAAVERKRALTSDEVVELTFRVSNVIAALDLPDSLDGRITFDRSVPIGNGTFLEFGTVTDDMVVVLDAITEAVPHWHSYRLLSEPTAEGERRFELRLVDPAVLSMVIELGGYIDHAAIEDGDYRMRIHVGPSADVRQLIDVVREEYPKAELVARQQIARESDSPTRLATVIDEQLTDRQRAALESAYFAGYFEWPRNVTGEEVADTLGVAPPTFHQHLRNAEQTLLGVALDDGASA